MFFQEQRRRMNPATRFNPSTCPQSLNSNWHHCIHPVAAAAVLNTSNPTPKRRAIQAICAFYVADTWLRHRILLVSRWKEGVSDKRDMFSRWARYHPLVDTLEHFLIKTHSYFHTDTQQTSPWAISCRSSLVLALPWCTLDIAIVSSSKGQGVTNHFPNHVPIGPRDTPAKLISLLAHSLQAHLPKRLRRSVQLIPSLLPLLPLMHWHGSTLRRQIQVRCLTLLLLLLWRPPLRIPGQLRDRVYVKSVTKLGSM